MGRQLLINDLDKEGIATLAGYKAHGGYAALEKALKSGFFEETFKRGVLKTLFEEAICRSFCRGF